MLLESKSAFILALAKIVRLKGMCLVRQTVVEIF